jgi:ketosteroid isomerase-like protein
MPDETADIRAAADRFIHALDHLDWDAFTGCWSSDPTMFFPNEPVRLDGRDAVLGRFRAMFEPADRSSGPPYLRLTPRNVRVEQFGEVGLVTLSFGQPPGPVALRSVLFVKDGAGWKIAHVHGTGRFVSD